LGVEPVYFHNAQCVLALGKFQEALDSAVEAHALFVGHNINDESMFTTLLKVMYASFMELDLGSDDDFLQWFKNLA